MKPWFPPLVLAIAIPQTLMTMTTTLAASTLQGPVTAKMTAIVQGPMTAQPVRTIEPAGAPISLSFRSLQPGEAILARLRNDASVKRVVLSLGGKVRVLEPAAGNSPGSPSALLGFDLGMKPQVMTLKIRIERLDGKTSSVKLPLSVEARKYPSTRLDVAPAMTNPPAKELETIRRESELVSEVLSLVSPDWLAEGPFQSPLPAYEPFPNFGQQRIFNKIVASVHSGVDISAPRGTEAEAPNGGRIVLAARLYFSGYTVIIDHGRGVFTYCCHFDELLVKRGDRVRKGQAIAKVGTTGRSTGPHLHWSVLILSARVDPFSLVALPL